MHVRTILYLSFILILLPIPGINLALSSRVYIPPYLLAMFIVFPGISLFAYFNNPDPDTFIRKVISVVTSIYALGTAFFAFGLALMFFKNPEHKDFYLRSASDIGDFLLICLIIFILPAFIVCLMNLEGTIILWIRIKSLFTKTSGREVIMARKEKQGRDERIKDYQSQLDSLDKREEKMKHKLTVLAKENPELLPEVMRYLPKDTGIYKGYIGEIEHRFQERQLQKTLRESRSRVEEAVNLGKELASLYRSRAEIQRAQNEFLNVGRELKLKDKRLAGEEGRVDLEIEIQRLELEEKKAALEKKLKKHREAPKSKTDLEKDWRNAQLKKIMADKEFNMQKLLIYLSSDVKKENEINKLMHHLIAEATQEFLEAEGAKNIEELSPEAAEKLNAKIMAIKERFYQIQASEH